MINTTIIEAMRGFVRETGPKTLNSFVFNIHDQFGGKNGFGDKENIKKLVKTQLHKCKIYYTYEDGENTYYFG